MLVQGVATCGQAGQRTGKSQLAPAEVRRVFNSQKLYGPRGVRSSTAGQVAVPQGRCRLAEMDTFALIGHIAPYFKVAELHHCSQSLAALAPHSA